MPFRPSPFAAVLAIALGSACALGSAGAQTNAQTDSAREFTMHLDLPHGPPPPVQPSELWRSVILPTPGTEILQRQPAPVLPPKPTVVPSAAAAVTGATLLEDSQRRRQSALQAENARLPIDDPARQTSVQMQGLTFERETRAQDLGSAIMRSSERAVGH